MWTNDTELLAQLIEVVSVVASEMKLKEPIKMRRPSWITAVSGGGRNPFSDAINRMRAAGPPRQR